MDPPAREDPAFLGYGGSGHDRILDVGMEARKSAPVVRHLDLRQGRGLGRAEVGISICPCVPHASYRQRELIV
jgi:hypothetical protein